MLKVVVVGLGYVGLPIALAFSEKYETYGYDINKRKIQNYKENIDETGEIESQKLKNTKLKFTSEEDIIKIADIIIIAVPTPINKYNKPDLSDLKNATKIVAKNIKKGAIIIYESTVFPGATEEICVPIIEKVSGLIYNKEFYVVYSPERINPGDEEHSFKNVNKIISASTPQITDKVTEIYQKCINAKIKKVSSIKVAEATKILENTQRDINVAFMNEMSKIFKSMDIDISEVIEAANTKWNFLDFKPGLVGGHCIGVDPYYLIYKAKKIKCIPSFLIQSRKINNSMEDYIIDNLLKILDLQKNKTRISKVLIKGLTFKENVSDIRNSKIINIALKLKRKGVQVYLDDYMVNNKVLKEQYGLLLSKKIPKVDAVIIAVKHNDYYNISIENLNSYYRKNNKNKILFDLNSIYNKMQLKKEGFIVWSL